MHRQLNPEVKKPHTKLLSSLPNVQMLKIISPVCFLIKYLISLNTVKILKNENSFLSSKYFLILRQETEPLAIISL